MSKRIVIVLDADASGATREIAATRGELVKMDGAADGAAKGGLARMKTAITGLVTAAALQQLVAYAGRLYELATAAEETGSKFATVFGPAASDLDGALRALANRAGLTQTEIRGLASTIGAVAQGLGMGQRASADYAAEVVALSADIASFSNVQGGAERVTQAVISAMTGEREALKSLGIVINEEAVKQRQAARAAEGHADAMTDAGKAAATLDLITEKAGAAVGDLERTSDSAANTGRRLAAVAREEEERFARLNQVTIQFVQGALQDLITNNRAAGRSFAEVLARGVLATVSVMVQAVTATFNLGRSIVGLGRAASDVAGQGGFSVFAFSVNAVLGTIVALEKRVLQATRAVRKMQLAWAEFRGDTDAVLRHTWSIYNLTTAIDEAEASLNRMGRTYAGTVFVPSGNLGGSSLGQSLKAFDELVERLDDLPDMNELFNDRQVGDGLAERVNDAADEVADAVSDGAAREQAARKKAAEEAEKARRLQVDKEHRDREERITAMHTGLEKELASIALAFDREREAYRRRFGQLTTDEKAMFEASQATVEQEARVNDGRRRGRFAREITRTASGGEIGPRQFATPEQIDREREEMQELAELQSDALGTLRTNYDRLGDAAVSSAERARTGIRGIADEMESVTATFMGLANNSLQHIDSLTGALGGIFQQAAEEGGIYFEVYKGIAIAQAASDTFRAANAAYAAGSAIPVIGVAAGPAAAAAAVAAGLANVARIRAMTPGGAVSGGRGAPSGRAVSGTRTPLVAGLNLSPQTLGGQGQAPVNVAAPVVNVPADTRPIVVQVDGRAIAVANRRGESQLSARYGGGGGL